VSLRIMMSVGVAPAVEPMAAGKPVIGVAEGGLLRAAIGK
jgi:hypothetical protein